MNIWYLNMKMDRIRFVHFVATNSFLSYRSLQKLVNLYKSASYEL